LGNALGRTFFCGGESTAVLNLAFSTAYAEQLHEDMFTTAQAFTRQLRPARRPLLLLSLTRNDSKIVRW
jgi:hypothetical protein